MIEKIKLNADTNFEKKYKDSYKFTRNWVKSRYGDVCHNIQAEVLVKDCSFFETIHP